MRSIVLVWTTPTRSSPLTTTATRWRRLDRRSVSPADGCTSSFAGAMSNGGVMASLQARHSRRCAIGKPWTPADKTDGCTCPRGPLFHVVVREGGAKSQTAVGRNRRDAERALTKIQGEADEGTYRPL